jgi:hypothetical protein
MASPFAMFRKRQKLWMAVACLLAIIAFVFLPNMGSLLSDTKGQEDLVVVKTKKYGDLRLSGMQRLRSQKQKVRAVLVELVQQAGLDPARAEDLFNRTFGKITDDNLVDTWLKVQRAQEIGMVISDDTVTRFLEEWTAKRVPIDRIEEAFKRTPAVTDAQFYDLLRDELLAMRFTRAFVVSIFAGGEPIATPSQRWDWFNRVNRMAVIEAVPLAVADYVNKVKDPDDKDDKVLKAFFEENKDRLPNPASPEPGFKRPQKAALEYFQADIAKFAAKVTSAEILKQYEENKDEYDRRFRIPPPRRPAKPEAAKDAEKAKKADEIKPKPQPNAANKTVPTAKPPVVEPKTEPKTPSETPKKEQKPPAADTKQAPPKATPNPETKEPNKAHDSKGASSAASRSPFMLAAAQTEKSADKPPKSPAVSDPSVKAAPPPVKAESSPAKPEKPAAKEQKPAAKKALSQKDAAELFEELPVALKTEIRQQIALEKIQRAFENLRKPVEEYQQECRKYDLLKIQRERAKQKAPPPRFSVDLEKIAKENGLSFNRTKLLSVWQAQESEIGASLIRGAIPVWAYIYQTSKFRYAVSRDANAAYLFWKNDDEKETVPKFDDKGVREEVLHAWKMIQARSLAKKAAKSLADQASSGGKRLDQLVKDRPDMRVVLPPKFSWMTEIPVASTTQQRPRFRISAVAGVPMAGDDFMATVFQLEPGQVGVAFNAPETVVYVVRPSEFTHSYEVRWKLFLADSFATYADVGMADDLKVLEAWNEEIKKSAGFEWGPGRKVEQANAPNRGNQQQQPIDDED